LLAPKSAKSREFELVAGQGHRRSLIVVSIESTHATPY